MKGGLAMEPPMNMDENKSDCAILPHRSSRLITRNEAAAYCRLSSQGFSRWIKRGYLPGPIAGTARWDLKAIDAALDRASDIIDESSSSPLDLWRQNRARSS